MIWTIDVHAKVYSTTRKFRLVREICEGKNPYLILRNFYSNKLETPTCPSLINKDWREIILLADLSLISKGLVKVVFPSLISEGLAIEL